MSGFLRGQLGPATDGPDEGERYDDLASTEGFRIEQIRSGQVDTPIEYLAATDEWVLVVDGAAVVEVNEESIELHTGDWLLIPANLPHRLLWVAPGTSWLAVHGTIPGASRG